MNLSGSTFKILVRIPRKISLRHESKEMERDPFYEWLWTHLGGQGLVGIHEGSVLSEQAAQQGFETDSWTVDSAEAPRERDWIGHQEEVQAELYFSNFDEAESARQYLKEISDLEMGDIQEQKPQDWDAEWKASFLNAGEGVKIPPFWKIVPPWVEIAPTDQEISIKINPGAGFGTGTHETTQLCLQVLGELKLPLEKVRTLDFGSGSGILSIGMAQLGAKVDSVEIDLLALDNAQDNARLNCVEEKICFSQTLSEEGRYKLIIANILRPVLLEFSTHLVRRLEEGGRLILSGLIQSDLESVIHEYSRLLHARPIRIYEKGEWRALLF